MSGRPAAGREVADQVQALMDGLLVEEHRAGEALDAGVRGIANYLTERVHANGRGSHELRGTARARLLAAVPGLLLTPEQVLDMAGPVVSNLLAVSRERVLPVITRQLRVCQRAVGSHALHVASAGVTAAESVAPELEGRYYAVACAAIGAAVAVTAGRMSEQARVWSRLPGEGSGELARRWCSEDPVRLPGCPGRGVVWVLRAECASKAREASVAVVNGLLLAGIAGWNHAAAAS